MLWQGEYTVAFHPQYPTASWAGKRADSRLPFPKSWNRLYPVGMREGEIVCQSGLCVCGLEQPVLVH